MNAIKESLEEDTPSVIDKQKDGQKKERGNERLSTAQRRAPSPV